MLIIGPLWCTWQARAEEDSDGRLEVYNSCFTHTDHPREWESTTSKQAPAAHGIWARRGASTPDEDLRTSQVNGRALRERDGRAPQYASSSSPSEEEDELDSDDSDEEASTTASNPKKRPRADADTSPAKRAFVVPGSGRSDETIVRAASVAQPYSLGDIIRAKDAETARQQMLERCRKLGHDFGKYPMAKLAQRIRLFCRQNREFRGVSHWGCCPAEIRASPLEGGKAWRVALVHWRHKGHWEKDAPKGPSPSSSGSTGTTSATARTPVASTSARPPNASISARPPVASTSSRHEPPRPIKPLPKPRERLHPASSSSRLGSSASPALTQASTPGFVPLPHKATASGPRQLSNVESRGTSNLGSRGAQSPAVPRARGLADLVTLFESIPDAEELVVMAPALYHDQGITAGMLRRLATSVTPETKEECFKDFGMEVKPGTKVWLRMVLEYLRNGETVDGL